MANGYDDDREVTYEIVEEIGVISSQSTGWTKELNVVAWNGGQGKYDIREWSPHHDRMSKGITLNEQEMRAIVDLLKRRARYVPKGVNTARGLREEPPLRANDISEIPAPSDDEGWERLRSEPADDFAKEPAEEIQSMASAEVSQEAS